MMILGKQLTDTSQTGRHHVIDGLVIGRRQLLRQLPHLQSRGKPDLAFVGCLLTGHQAKQAGFTRTVATNQADPLATIELKAHFIQQRIEPVGQRYIGKRKQRHNSPVGYQAGHSTLCGGNT